eukprot:jgi/Bigna1/84904/estExt_fgenesh1_pg.C_10330
MPMFVVDTSVQGNVSRDQFQRIKDAVMVEEKLCEKQKNYRMYSRIRPYPEILHAFICGLHDPKSNLNRLRGQSVLLKKIWQYLLDMWACDVEIGHSPIFNPDELVKSKQRVPYAMICKVDFPEPSGININMMPIRIGATTLRVQKIPVVDKATLPKKMHQYVPMIDRCLVDTATDAIGKVFYLTIHESEVKKGWSQRRPGLHVESPGFSPQSLWRIHSDFLGTYSSKPPEGRKSKKDGIPRKGLTACGMVGDLAHSDRAYLMEVESACNEYCMHVFGISATASVVTGAGAGLATDCFKYSQASGWRRTLATRAQSIQLYSTHQKMYARLALIHHEGSVHAFGDIEHMRPLLEGTERKLKEGELIWMTDRTPHESLPINKTTHHGGIKSRGVKSFVQRIFQKSSKQPSTTNKNLKQKDKPTPRQFFRLVGPNISVWFADHSTANKRVKLPKEVMVVRGNKFKMLDNEGRFSLPKKEK